MTGRKMRFGTFFAEHRAELVAFFLVFALVALRFLYYGFTYFYQLDDYSQHYLSATMRGPLESITSMGLLANRPLAGLLDVTLYSWLFPVAVVGMLLLSALYAASALLLQKVFARHFGTGWVFIVLFALLPLGFEGTYWISASSRIVNGLFFLSLSAYLLQKYFDGGGKVTLILALVFQLVSYGFYEQAMILSITLNILLGLLMWKTIRKKAFWSLFSLVNVGVYVGFTSIFKAQYLYGERMSLILPNDPAFFSTHLHHVLDQFYDAFLKGGLLTTVKGFVRGAQIMIADHAVLFLLILVALCVLTFFLARTHDLPAKRSGSALLCGFLLFLAPLSIFLILENSWFSLRCTVMSFAGLALFADGLLMLLVRRWRGRTVFSAGLAAGLAFVFCVAGVSELHDYKLTYEQDTAVGSAVAAALDGETLYSPAVVFNVNPNYLSDQNYYYHEHIHGATESPWAFTALVQYSGQFKQEILDIMPIPGETSIFAPGAPVPAQIIDGYETFYFYDNGTQTAFPVTCYTESDGSATVRSMDGDTLAKLQNENGSYYLRLTP
ncbi:MAG: glucosyltransferase domain-containing protein [Oscillospiraceae bacterium]